MTENMHDELLSTPDGTTLIENQQQDRYPGLRVRRDGDAVVIHIPARFRRRCCEDAENAEVFSF